MIEQREPLFTYFTWLLIPSDPLKTNISNSQFCKKCLIVKISDLCRKRYLILSNAFSYSTKAIILVNSLSSDVSIMSKLLHFELVDYY